MWMLHRHELDTFESYYDEGVGEVLRDVGPRMNVRLTLPADVDPMLDGERAEGT